MRNRPDDARAVRTEFDFVLPQIMLDFLEEDPDLYRSFADDPEFRKRLAEALYPGTLPRSREREQETDVVPEEGSSNGALEERAEEKKEREKFPQPSDAPRRNYRITDDALGTGGAKTKYARNVEAIRTLRRIEEEGRLATSEEQEVLARYVGWGGLPQAFDERNEAWSKEYAELKGLLSDEEYAAARGSTLNAYYTSPTVVKAIYGTLERMGLSSGNILEPACGTGNFFGLVPESMAGAKLYGVELDGITGRIARQLYQEADITVGGYEKTRFPDNFFDAAVGNVPFGAYRVADPKYDKHGFMIHDYFFAKALDQVRPGGVVAFVTSKGTLDKANPSVRQYIARRAELLGAVRLPNNAFKANAGTNCCASGTPASSP